MRVRVDGRKVGGGRTTLCCLRCGSEFIPVRWRLVDQGDEWTIEKDKNDCGERCRLMSTRSLRTLHK